MNRTLGFDLGSKTLGVSVSDPLGMIARALTTLRFDSDDYDSALAQAQALIRSSMPIRSSSAFPPHERGHRRARRDFHRVQGKAGELRVEVVFYGMSG